jgi:large subunit ribosomal protein L4
MATIKVIDQNKQEAGEVTLAPEVFEVAPRAEILHLVVRAQRAAWRAGTHSTLSRSMMKGGGAKPWRQKGTGRARSGSNISPLWTGGAVLFGPSPRDYSFKINKKVRRLALRMALSVRLLDNQLTVLKNLELPEAKTRHFVKIANGLEWKKALVVVPAYDETLDRASCNVRNVTLITPEDLNVYDIINHPQLVILEGAVEGVTKRLA